MNVIGGVILLLAAAVLAFVLRLSFIIPFAVLGLLVVTALALIFANDERARALVGKWWGSCRSWFAGTGGWSLWEAVALGLVFFGIFAGAAFLEQPLVVLAAILAPWLAGRWAARRGTQFPSLLATLAGAVVGVVEGRFFLDWLPDIWREFPAWLLALVVSALIGAGLGFWAFARGQFRPGKQ
ncbi:MAG: hypothetical protein ACM3X6_08360 [Patescibacteria group bacterium]